MEDNSALKIFPKTRIKPYDGMAVTADIWAQSHEEHRKARQAHDVLFHRPGIITGLDVQANEPPDQYVFISPGVAVDSAGNVIVLTEPVAYNIETNAEGLLYLLLGHGERETGGVDGEVKQIHAEFVVAARSSLPKRPVVELARLRVVNSKDPICNATNAFHPAAGELDLRFRAQSGETERRSVYVGLCHFGREVEDVSAGWRYLAAEAERSSAYRLILDAGLSPTAELGAYDLVYLSARGAFNPDAASIKSLQAYFDTRNTLFAEAFDDAAEQSFKSLFEKLGRKLAPLSPTASLLESPFLFVSPPAGAQGNNLQAGKQLIFSTAGYSLAWAGKLPFELRARSDIRAVHEWGINLIQYCLGPSSA